MLHIFFGNNTIAVRNKAYAFAMPFEQDGVKLVRIDGDTYQPGLIANSVGAASLFGERSLYLIDTPSVSDEFADEVRELLLALHESPNTFVVIESTLLAGPKKMFGKHADSIEEITATKVDSFNVFALADSLSRKDKKTLWLGLCNAKQAGLSAEEIIGTLWWQLKTLRLASSTRTASEAGMKDFPYSKAKRSLSAFKEGELDMLSMSLLKLYHEGHMGECDIDLALERWTLTI